MMSPPPRRADSVSTAGGRRLRTVSIGSGSSGATPPGSRADEAGVPPAFAAALAALRAAVPRAEVLLSEVPGPARLAPYSCAFVAELADETHGSGQGRFVVLHDPEGPEGWDGDVRVVAFARSTVDVDMAHDPLLTDVGWAWLQESLEAHGAAAVAVGGTVTRTASQRFGTLVDEPDQTEIEVRASWTPTGTDLADALPRHLHAWTDLVCSTAGLPPAGTSALPLAAG